MSASRGGGLSTPLQPAITALTPVSPSVSKGDLLKRPSSSTQGGRQRIGLPVSFKRLSARSYGSSNSGNALILGENLKVLRNLRESA
jgi:hypothetical protein